MNIDITNEERYEFIKLYDILRDMDFELTDNQVSVFDKVQEQENWLKALTRATTGVTEVRDMTDKEYWNSPEIKELLKNDN